MSIQTPIRTNLDQINKRTFSPQTHSGLALLSSPPETSSIISGGRVYCEGLRAILVLSAGVRIVAWYLLLDLVRSPYQSKIHSLVHPILHNIRSFCPHGLSMTLEMLRSVETAARVLWYWYYKHRKSDIYLFRTYLSFSLAKQSSRRRSGCESADCANATPRRRTFYLLQGLRGSRAIIGRSCGGWLCVERLKSCVSNV